LDLENFKEPYLPRLRAWLAGLGRDLWVLDLTTDLNIPVFAACSRRVNAPAEHIMFGFGSHMDPRIAMLRAVTELNQMLSLLLDAPPDGPPPKINDEETVKWLMEARLAEHPYLSPRDQPLRRQEDYPQDWSDDVLVDIDRCVARTSSLGLDFLVLDQTRPEIGMPVVKVVVPGLRHFWPRFAPGRLYDVPVKLGWQSVALTEEQMNPIPMFL
jgi:ribosomal protein S12 methylthiotransferase accessory factor